MATVWIGDFRCKQLQQYQSTAGSLADNIYILEDAGEYSWFSTGLLEQLPQLALEKADAVITLGFNDCVYSCVWDVFNIKKIATDYAKTINELIEQYPSIKFYVCSVNPIDTDYSFAEYSTNGVIPNKVLIDKINQFNARIKSICKATYIDTCGYLTSTSFYTHDGVLFDTDTLASIDSYISLKIARSGGTLFVPRLTAPVISIERGGEYWLGDSYGGVNPFDDLGQSYGKVEGDTLPNCTAYAWGRFYEILGSKPTLSTGNAEQWYLNTADGYKRGKEPALGAIICWQAGASTDPAGDDGAGHVAIVEQINPDGSIVTSESGWNSASYWWTTTRTKGNDGNWGQGSSYKFQGFIYCPATTAVTKENLCVKNSYDISLEEMKPNAQYIWQYFGQRGWTMNAVAGMLGNIQQESKMSPCVWEDLINGSTIDQNTGKHTLNTSVLSNFHGGYGLTQWTPYTKYIAWCNNGSKIGNANGTGGVLPYWEIDTQLQRIEAEVEASKRSWVEGLSQWIKNSNKGYDLTFSEFITSTKDASWLAEAFAFCYERPGRSTGSAAEQAALRKERGEYGKYWYKFLNSLPPITSDTALRMDNIRVINHSSTSVTVSSLVRNIENLSYIIDDKAPKEVKVTGDFITFPVKDLTPNKEYSLTLTTVSSNGSELSENITFTTPQDYPESINNIELIAKDSVLPYDNFRLVVTPSTPDFGYWKKNKGYGYTIQLIVNGRVKKEKEVSSLPSAIKISEYFNYVVKVGDTIQIGIRTRVKYKSETLYDSDFTKASNTICMLTKPVVAYLNTD